MSNQKIAFPDSNIPESKKDKEYYKKYIQGIVGCSIDSSYDLSVSLMTDCYRYYQGTQGGEEFEFLQKAEDGDSLPALWINYNKIKIKIDVLLGELSAKGFEIDVRAINKDAVSRKMKVKNKLYVAMRMREVYEELEQIYGLPIMQGGFIPDNEDDLKDYMDSGYKETSELVMKYCLEFLIKKFNWAYTRLALFRDVLIVGKCFVQTEVVNGWPVWNRLDPRKVVYDKFATDDFLSDSSYKGYVDFPPIADVAEQFNLSKDEVNELHQCKGYVENPSSFNSSFLSGDPTSRDLLNSIGRNLYPGDKHTQRVMVFYAEWDDTRIEARKYSKDSYGNEHVKRVKDTDKGDDVESRRIKTIRKGYLIGGKILKEEGILKNEIRSCDDPSDTKKSIESLIPNYLDFTAVSKVMQQQGLQKLKDITMYNIQRLMNMAGPRGFVYDVSQCPEGWEPDDVIAYLKKVGIAFINSKENGVPSSFNQFSQFDLGISSSVNNLLEISRMIDYEMDAITGINDARQGIVRNTSLAVGVAQSALNQSNLATEMLFELFSQMTDRVFNRIAALTKLVWPEYKERFAPIIGESGIDFLEMDLDMDLDDYGVFAENLPAALQDKQGLMGMAQSAVQAGQITFKHWLIIFSEKDIKVGIRKFYKALALTEQKQQEQAEAQRQAEAQQMQMQQQMTTEREDQKTDKSMQAKAFIEGLKGRNQKEAMQSQEALKNLFSK